MASVQVTVAAPCASSSVKRSAANAVRALFGAVGYASLSVIDHEYRYGGVPPFGVACTELLVIVDRCGRDGVCTPRANEGDTDTVIGDANDNTDRQAPLINASARVILRQPPLR